MPPKATKKVKADATPEPATPKKTAAAKPATPKTATPKKPKEVVIYASLAKATGTAIPIDVAYEGSAVQAKLAKSGGFQHNLQLEAPRAFSLVKSVVFTKGEYEGYQAVLLRPAKAFPFLKLPEVARARIYGFYFAQMGVVGEAIVLEGKRTLNKDIYAKAYAEGSKNRVGLLAVNKEVSNSTPVAIISAPLTLLQINEETIKVFYAHTLKLESTTTLLDFLSQIPTSVRARLTSLHVKSYIKASSRNAMYTLAGAKNLTRLHISSGVFADGDPGKAAKQFYADAYKFLESIGAAKGDKTAGVDVLQFGKQAFTFKDDKKNVKPWTAPLIVEFKENLRIKLE
ncbi:hypothetical protein LTR53_014356 [Teratosphaeriaceae sp. CCFEE 6253]|nr:hypothetical protein LTR53_014356 [Teratosphaeriaceae sp. CCFEE 6253]